MTPTIRFLRRICISRSALVLWLIGLQWALGFSQVQASAEVVKPDQVVGNSYRSIQQKIDDKVLVAGLPEQQLLQLVEQELGQLFDFQRVARKVMGKYARQASEQQLVEFDRVFKHSLVATYSKGLKGLEQLKTVEIGTVLYDRKGVRAKVPTVIVLKDGRRYQVLYRMFISDQRQWRAENLIVEGVNIGLVFRNQFAHYMEQHANIDEAINSWAAVTGKQ